ncbi:hypothetical protein MEO94_24640, partial [Dolichospermum sp. ST_sed9]|nr:hypothetical protein [Dolichospermum sp. ST_sed9]
GVGIGTTNSFADKAIAANNLAVQGSVGIGTTSPYSSSPTLGVVGGIAIGTTDTYSNKQTPTGGLIIEGNTGIGLTAPSAKLAISSTDAALLISTTWTDPSSQANTSKNDTVAVFTADSAIQVRTNANYSYTRVSSGFTASGTQATYHGAFYVDAANLGTISTAYGNYFLSGLATGASGTVTQMNIYNAGVYAQGANTVAYGTWRGLYVEGTTAANLNGATIGSLVGVDVGAISAGTTNIAYRGTVAAATGRWNLYMNGTADNYLAGNVGIATTSPINKLAVIGAATIGTTNYNVTAPTSGLLVEGNVGIGLTAPVAKLHVSGSEFVSGNLGIGTTTPKSKLSVLGNVGIGSTAYTEVGAAPSGGLIVEGNTGIGTSVPTSKLDVNGTLKVHSVVQDDSFNYDDSIYFAPQAYFEAGSTNAPSGWSWSIDGFTTVNETTVPFSKVALSSTYDYLNSGYIPVQPGDSIYGEIWAMRASDAVGDAGLLYMGVERYDKDKLPIASNSGTTYFTASAVTVPLDSTWHKYSGTAYLPTSHTPYSGSDGGPVRYIRVRIYVNFSTGTIPTNWGGILVRRVQPFRDSGNLATAGNLGIGTTLPGTKLSVAGGVGIGSTDSFANAAIAASNLAVQGNVGIGTTSPLSSLDVRTGNVGIGTTMAAAYKLDVNGDIRIVSGSDLYVGVIGLNDVGSSTTSGAYLIGLEDDAMTYIAADTTVQGAIKELDTALGTVAGSAGGWTDDGDIVRLTTSTNRVGIGTTSTNANTKLAVVGGVAIGTQGTYADVQVPTNGLIVEGNVGIGTTSPLTALHVTGDFTLAGGDITGANSAAIDIGEQNSGDITLTGDVITANGSYIGIGTTTMGRIGFTDSSTDLIEILSADLDMNNQSIGSVNQITIADTGSTEGYCFPAGCVSQGIAVSTTAQGGFNAFVFTTPASYPYIFSTTNAGLGIGNTSQFATTSLPASTVSILGNVGIGTTSPKTQLAVVGGVGIGTTDSFANAAVAANNLAVQGSIGIGTTSPTTLLQLGFPGATAGTFSLAGVTSGLVTIDVAAAAGTWALTLPTDDGDSNQVLITDGDGNTSWADISTIPGADATTLDGLDSTDFLRATASDTFEGIHNRTLTIQSLLTADNRSASLLDITQANDPTYNLSTHLVSLSQLDTASTGNALYINNLGSGFSLRIDDEGSDTTSFVVDASGNLGIGTTSPGTKLSIVGGVGIGTTDNFANAAIAANNLAVQGNLGIATTSPLSTLDVRAGNVGIGTTMAAAYKLDVNGDIRVVAGSDYYIGVVGLNDNAGSASGASLIGLYDDSMVNIATDTTVQGAIKELDTALVGIGTSANYWTRSGTSLIPTTAGDIVATAGNVGVGITTGMGSKLSVNGSVAIGTSTTYSSKAAPTNGLIIEGNVGIGTTSPLSTLDIRTGNVGIGTTMAATQTLDIQGNLRLTGALYDYFNSAGTAGYVLTSGGVGVGTTWAQLSTLPVGNADTLDTLHAASFLRSDTSDNFTSGILTFDSATELNMAAGSTLDVNGVVAIGSTAVSFDGVSTNFATTGNFSINTTQLYLNQSTGNLGIGTSVPTKGKLNVLGAIAIGSTAYTEVAGAAPANGLIVEGNVGIGKTNPAAALDIYKYYYQVDDGTYYGVKVVPQINMAGEEIGILVGGYFAPTFNDESDFSPNDIYGIQAIVNSSNLQYNVGCYFSASGGSQNYAIIVPPGGGSVGIGTITPKSTLDIEGGVTIGATYSGTSVSPTNGLIVEGNVGIGTTNPSYPLVVSKNTNGEQIMLNLYNPNSGEGIGESIYFSSHGSVYPAAKIKAYTNAGSSGRLQFYTGDGGVLNTLPAIHINNSNLIGIGTTVPTKATLNIKGNVAIGSTAYTEVAGAAPTNGLIVEGNVGIGTTAPTAKLNVVGGNLTFENPGVSTMDILLRTDDVSLVAGEVYDTAKIQTGFGADLWSRGYISFFTHHTESPTLSETMRIVGGNVGIGTTSPLAGLHIGTGGTPGYTGANDVYIQNDLEIDGS